jgi:uncharacterized protein (DUF2235 family)
MPKNIVIFSDGTGQAGGLRPDQALSNVYKLYRASRVSPENDIDPAQQVAFYDAGLGTEKDEGSIPIKAIKAYRKALSGATGTGISRNIADCYEAILKHYESGDRIFLFGFSRGAYTARCVGGVLSYCGIPTQAADGTQLPRYGRALRDIAVEAVREVYEHGSGKAADSKYTAERLEKAKRFRKKYGSANSDGEANVLPYFIGVFDTVAALGSAGLFRWVLFSALIGILAVIGITFAVLVKLILGVSFWPVAGALVGIGLLVALWLYLQQNLKTIRDFPNAGDVSRHVVSWHLKFYNTFLNKRVAHARHAMAIDENRQSFGRVPWDVEGDLVRYELGRPEWLKQVWFAGNHSDIGGSYPEDESRLSDFALEWMIEQASELGHPLLLDRTKLKLFPSASGMQHSEISSMRDKYPSRVPFALRYVWPKQPREVFSDAILHPSVYARYSLPMVMQYGIAAAYRPDNLSSHVNLRNYYSED